MAEAEEALGFDPDALREKYREERDKRLRPEGNAQYIEIKGDFSHFEDDPYVEPGFTREPIEDEVDVALIGGGFGGLLAGARLRQLGVEDVRIIEKGGDFGGPTEFVEIPKKWRDHGALEDLEMDRTDEKQRVRMVGLPASLA